MGVVQFSNIPEAETAIGECVHSTTVSYLTILSTQPNFKIICMVEDRWVRLFFGDFPLSGADSHGVLQMLDSTTVGTPSPRPLPRVVRVCFQTKVYNLGLCGPSYNFPPL